MPVWFLCRNRLAQEFPNLGWIPTRLLYLIPEHSGACADSNWLPSPLLPIDSGLSQTSFPKILSWVSTASLVKEVHTFPSLALKNRSFMIPVTYLENNPPWDAPSCYPSAHSAYSYSSSGLIYKDCHKAYMWWPFLCIARHQARLPPSQPFSFSHFLFFFASTPVMLVRQESNLVERAQALPLNKHRIWFLALPVTSFVISDLSPH